MVVEARKDTATNNIKQTKTVELGYTCTWNSIDVVSKLVHVIIQLFSTNLLSGLAILAFFV